jgi:hypothetical protein
VNAIGRPVMPARVEQPVMMMSMTLDFGACVFSFRSVVVLYAGATFLSGLLACFFVSHKTAVLSLIVLFCFAPTSLGVAADLSICQFASPEASATLRAI